MNPNSVAPLMDRGRPARFFSKFPARQSSRRLHGARAEFDAFELRKVYMLRPEISLDELIAIVEKAKRREGLGRLLGALRAMRTVTNRLRATNARSKPSSTNSAAS